MILLRLFIAFLFITMSFSAYAGGINSCSYRQVGMPAPYVISFSVNSARVDMYDIERIGSIASRGRSRSKICVLGYVDRQGHHGFNRQLAMKRAVEVSDILVGYGISRGVLTVDIVDETNKSDVFGALRPIDEIRRVEIIFVR